MVHAACIFCLGAVAAALLTKQALVPQLEQDKQYTQGQWFLNPFL